MTSLWKMAQITSKLKAVGQCGAAGGHCPSAALLRRARDSTQLGESESRSDIPSSWDNDPGLWAQCQWALAGCQALPAPPHTSWKSGTVRDYGQGLGGRGQLLDRPREGPGFLESIFIDLATLNGTRPDSPSGAGRGQSLVPVTSQLLPACQ